MNEALASLIEAVIEVANKSTEITNMKTFMAVAAALLAFLTGPIHAAQTANARMYCLSIQFNRAVAGGQSGLFSLDLTGINNGINGELFPVFEASRSHFTFLTMTFFDEDEIPGTMSLDVPNTDSDGDGFPDIFDTAKAFGGISPGTVNFPSFYNGNVTASWSRSANSHVGTCVLNFHNFGSFTHTFTILEYKGPLTYTPGETVVAANVDLALTGIPNQELKGPISFTKSVSDPANELDFMNGIWTNALPETPEAFSFVAETFYRDAAWPTNYYGYFEFNDWLLSTAEPDYYLWFVSIDDLNDADHDGIPDFSDNPSSVVPRRPLLALTRAQNNLQLTISGNVGQICQIQRSPTINAAIWPTISSVTLTNDPQIINLPLPTDQTAFWRIQVQ